MDQVSIKYEQILDERCRVCLECRESSISLLNTIIINNLTLSYWDLLLSISKIENENAADVPKNICTTCAERAEASYEFKLLCEKSDKVLRSEFVSQDICINSDDFKSEELLTTEDNAVYYTENTIYMPDMKNENMKQFNCDEPTNSDSNALTTLHNSSVIKFEETMFLDSSTKNSEDSTDLLDTTSSNNKSGLDGMLKCDFCDYTNSSSLKLGKHMSINHDDKKIVQCPNCDKRFFKRRDVQQHIRRQHGNNVTDRCQVCGRIFKDKVNLANHMEQHTGIKKYECKLCNKRFTFYASLHKHEMNHSEDRNFKCEVCPAQFKTAFYLNQHVRKIHRKMKPLECTMCFKTLKNKETFNKHMRTVHQTIP